MQIFKAKFPLLLLKARHVPNWITPWCRSKSDQQLVKENLSLSYNIIEQDLRDSYDLIDKIRMIQLSCRYRLLGPIFFHRTDEYILKMKPSVREKKSAILRENGFCPSPIITSPPLLRILDLVFLLQYWLNYYIAILRRKRKEKKNTTQRFQRSAVYLIIGIICRSSYILF